MVIFKMLLQTREIIQHESVKETLETMREWRRNSFSNKLLNAWTTVQFSVPEEIEVSRRNWH